MPHSLPLPLPLMQQPSELPGAAGQPLPPARGTYAAALQQQGDQPDQAQPQDQGDGGGGGPSLASSAAATRDAGSAGEPGRGSKRPRLDDGGAE